MHGGSYPFAAFWDAPEVRPSLSVLLHGDDSRPYPWCYPAAGLTRGAVRVGSDVWIGAGATVMRSSATGA